MSTQFRGLRKAPPSHAAVQYTNPYDDTLYFGYPELEDEAEEELGATELAHAVQLNRRYSQSLGWHAYFNNIARLLGFTIYPPNEQEFARAVARWQSGLRVLTVDGVVGPTTWSQMRLAMGLETKIAFGLDTASVAGNKNPNWVQAKAKGAISFAIIRSNYGVAEDRVFKRDWPKIKDAGIVRGAYLFLRFPHPKHGMKAPDPISQAKAFIKAVGHLNESDFPPSLDVEFPGGGKVTGMTPKQLLDGVRAAWKVLKGYYGVAPIIYTSARVWREDLHNLSAPDLVESPLWLARYPFKPGPVRWGPFAGGPPVPPPWGDSRNWWIHQYQGDAVRLPGFPTGNVDMNRFKTMLKGETGDRVKWVQRRLGIAQNGRFDAAMENALRAFQNRKRLVSNGDVGLQTFVHLCWSNP